MNDEWHLKVLCGVFICLFNTRQELNPGSCTYLATYSHMQFLYLVAVLFVYLITKSWN